MRKQIITGFMIVSLFAGITSYPSFGVGNPGSYAKAATVSTCNLSKPSIYVAGKNGNTVKLCINQVAGATTYKVYRCNTKDGTYQCVGTTKSDVFRDNVNTNKTCFYKVKACKNTKNQKATSPFSNTAATPKATTPKTTTPPTTTATTTSTTPPKTTGTTANQSYADQVLKLVNQEREKAGLKALVTTDSLQKAANKRAVEIVSSFSHTRPDSRSFATVLGDYNINYLAAGENIAYGQKSPEEVMTAWMNSPGHRANILGSQFGKVGIGVYQSNGVYYWSQEFTN